MEKRNDFERVLMNIAVDTAGSCFDKMVRLDGDMKAIEPLHKHLYT